MTSNQFGDQLSCKCYSFIDGFRNVPPPTHALCGPYKTSAARTLKQERGETREDRGESSPGIVHGTWFAAMCPRGGARWCGHSNAMPTFCICRCSCKNTEPVKMNLLWVVRKCSDNPPGSRKIFPDQRKFPPNPPGARKIFPDQRKFSQNLPGARNFFPGSEKQQKQKISIIKT